MTTTIRYEFELPASLPDGAALHLIDGLRQRALTTSASYVSSLWRLSGTELLVDLPDYWPWPRLRHLTIRPFDSERDASRPVDLVGFRIRSSPRSDFTVVALFRSRSADGARDKWIWEYESESRSLFGQTPLMQLLNAARELGIAVNVSVHVDVALVNVEDRQSHVLESVRISDSSMLTWVPGASLESLGITPTHKKEMMRADGSSIARWSAPAILRVDGRETVDDVIICEADDEAVLGWRALSGLNLRLDQESGALVDRGPIPAAAA